MSGPERDPSLERLLLRRRALTAEGRHRPVWMPVLAVLVALVAGGWVILESAGVSAAERRHAGAIRAAFQIEQSIATLALLESQAEDRPGIGSNDSGLGPNTLVLAAARRAGLDEPDPANARSERIRDGITRVTYAYSNVRHPEIGPLLRWVAEVRGEAPWMSVGALKVENLGAVGWKIDVAFEQIESGR
ncbi:MAG: hypothetical protein AAF108_10850 [Planctomycetota bacterium]